MTTSLVDADSLLAVDIGSITTRAMLFDVVDGRYRFVAAGSAPSTAGAPFLDVGEGVRKAIDRLQSVTGRTLVDSQDHLIIPTGRDGTGVDSFAATISAGAPIKVVAVGLLEGISLESAHRLAQTTYTKVAESISLNDHRKPEARIDTILRLRPDLILIAGGTDDGAEHSMLRLLESVGLACYLMPKEQRPVLFFTGNQELHDEVEARLGELAHTEFAPNVRPAIEMEQIDPAHIKLQRLYSDIRKRQVHGVRELDEWANGNLMPTAAAFGRLVRFLSKKYTSQKGVLGVDVGASAASILAGFADALAVGVYPDLGLGAGLPDMLDGTLGKKEQKTIENILRWLPQSASAETLQEYIYNKSLFPGSVPGNEEELAIEEAITREILREAIRRVSYQFPDKARSPGLGLLPWFEPIIASGSVLTNSPTHAHSLLMLLDGLQPSGVTTMVLDQHHLAPALGVAAGINPLLTVQVLDSNAFLYLGTVISPVGNARPGTPVLRVKMTTDAGRENALDVKRGSLEVLPLPFGQTARMQLQPLHRFDVGMGGPGRGGKLRVHGGVLGVIIDARGRPLKLPEDVARRQELLKKWIWMLGS